MFFNLPNIWNRFFVPYTAVAHFIKSLSLARMAWYLARLHINIIFHLLIWKWAFCMTLFCWHQQPKTSYYQKLQKLDYYHSIIKLRLFSYGLKKCKQIISLYHKEFIKSPKLHRVIVFPVVVKFLPHRVMCWRHQYLCPTRKNFLH